ncbi:MAG: hypothetical protein ACRENU_10720, partial [Gemmatimonadaceae bacterium]
MAGWFAKLMEQSGAGAHARSSPAAAETRDARYDTIVQTLRDRDAEDRNAREARQRWYRQHLPGDSGNASSASSPAIRLHRFRTKVPCRATAEAQALLHELERQFPGATVTFSHGTNGRQTLMLSAGARATPKQVGWVEHCVQPDPERCNVRHQGLTVETDGGSMLILRFHHPPTGVMVSSSNNADDGTPHVDFTEIRPALDLRPSEKGSTPRLVWVTRPPEIETLNALQSRDYEAFYARLKAEVLAGVWSSMSSVLASAAGSQWHQGSYYSVVREADAANGRIQQRTLDDSGRAVDIGLDRIYDAFAATDILLLYLEADVLADFADICFTLQSFNSADAWFLKEEFFTVIRRFWAGSSSLTSRYGSDLATVVRMSQRAVPMPAQSPLLKQDWINLRQALVDRYGAGGRQAADLVGEQVHRSRITGASGSGTWPFASFPAGDVNVGLRLVYRQEWRHIGAERGEVIRVLVPPPNPEQETETSLEPDSATGKVRELADAAVRDTVQAMKWPIDRDGSINTGVRCLAASTDIGLEAECRESSRDTTARLSAVVLQAACKRRDETLGAASGGPEGLREPPTSPTEIHTDSGEPTHVLRRLRNRYEIATRPAEIQNVVLVAEKLPTPAQVGLAWVRRHDWILAKVLLDESFREALNVIGADAQAPDERRDRLYEHLRANILHYQRAIWQHE